MQKPRKRNKQTMYPCFYKETAMTQLDVRYIIFSHFNKKVINPDPNGPDKIDEHPLKELEKIKDDLQSLLASPEHPGLLLLFWHPGWIELLNSVGSDFNPKTFAKEIIKSELEKEEIEAFFSGGPLSDRIRLITACDLHPIVNNLRGDRPGAVAARLRRFLDGNQKGTLYDTAKVVEAIVHLRNLGSGIPILRVDWDVLFDKKNLTGSPLAVAIQDIKDTFTKRQNDPRVFSFMYSARYEHPTKPPSDWTSADWMKAYATRPHPALIADCQLLASAKSSVEAVNDYTHCFNEKVLNTFYEKLPEIGSDKETSIISGALLCMSDSAILDLPPCSNFDVNVMWIDDHLKYLLHQSLGHFKEYNNPILKSRQWSALISDSVNKERPDITDTNECKDISMYVLGTYLPTLLRGCIFDYWICNKKADPENNPGEFTMILQEALKRGYLDNHPALKDRLEKAAIRRIERVRNAWSTLTTIDKKDTFASLWVGDPNIIVTKSIDSSGTNYRLAGAGLGLLRDSKVTKINSTSDLSPTIKNDLDKLIDDALVYIEWTLYWPNFVQAVRSIEPGKLRVDLIG